MALRALVPGVVLAGLAFGAGFAAGGMRAAVSALLGVLIVSSTFALYVAAVGRARGISLSVLHAVTLGGWFLRLGILLASLFAVDGAGGDVAAFGLAAIGTALAVAIYEAWTFLVARPRDPVDTPGRVGTGA